jgi:holo-ACP synthase/triphosphoribosyl-dephospho-CoA synthase
MLSRGNTVNDAGVAAMLTLLAHTGDTNIAHRAGFDALTRIKRDMKDFLKTQPAQTNLRALYDKARELDAQFVAQNISPGGCADLLSVTFFLITVT